MFNRRKRTTLVQHVNEKDNLITVLFVTVFLFTAVLLCILYIFGVNSNTDQPYSEDVNLVTVYDD